MKRFAPLLLACLLAAPAFAGVSTTLLEDGRWRVIGIDAGAEPMPISVTRDKTALGDFSALQFFFDIGGSFVQVLLLDADGTIQPSLPPPGVAGAIATLGRYFECETGLTDALRFSALELPKNSNNDYLKLKGTLSNFDSLVSDKLKLYVLRPENNEMSIQMQYKLKTTRDICVDQTRQDTQEAFRIVQVDSRFVSASNQLNDVARYTKNIDLDCDVFGDCDLDRVRQCVPLENTTGYVFDSPNRLADHHIELFHSTNAPEATPTLDVVMLAPHFNRVKPQGFVTESSDPDALNVAVWADWVDVNGQYDANKTVGTFAFALEAEEPREPGCDRTQD